MKAQHLPLADFKMPFAPLTDYLVLIFLGFVAVVMLFKTETLIALIGAVAWFIFLFVAKSISMKAESEMAQHD